MRNPPVPVSKELIARLKREAKRRVKEKKIQHCAALNELAGENGYPHWVALLHAKTTTQPLTPAEKKELRDSIVAQFFNLVDEGVFGPAEDHKYHAGPLGDYGTIDVREWIADEFSAVADDHPDIVAKAAAEIEAQGPWADIEENARDIIDDDDDQ